MERSMGWRPRLDGDPVGAYAYLASLRRAEPHGGTFTYRSADTDMLGWVCERAAGTRMADLVSTLLWQPMGAEADAEITCDSVGTGIHDGGISAVARDLARFGRLLLEDGRRRRPRGRPGGLARGRVEPARRRQGRVRCLGQRARCCPAGGTATSSGSCRHSAVRRCSASASTVRWSTSTARPDWSASSSRRGRPLSTPRPSSTRIRAFGSIGVALAADGDEAGGRPPTLGP